MKHRPELATIIHARRSYEEAAHVLQDDVQQKEGIRNSMQDEFNRLTEKVAELTKERDVAEATLQEVLEHTPHTATRATTMKSNFLMHSPFVMYI